MDKTTGSDEMQLLQGSSTGMKNLFMRVSYLPTLCRATQQQEESQWLLMSYLQEANSENNSIVHWLHGLSQKQLGETCKLNTFEAWNDYRRGDKQIWCLKKFLLTNTHHASSLISFLYQFTETEWDEIVHLVRPSAFIFTSLVYVYKLFQLEDIWRNDLMT